jgi:hypothetical protein
MNFYSYINEGHEPMFKFPYKNVKIFWNTGKAGEEHTMDSRLERIGKTKKEVYEYMKKFINILKKENKNYGVYAIIFDTFKMIATYSKNRIFINTFLSKNMTVSHYDFQLQILEALENFTGDKYDENSFTVVKMLRESICVERGTDYIDIYGMHNSVFEVIEID